MVLGKMQDVRLLASALGAGSWNGSAEGTESASRPSEEGRMTSYNGDSLPSAEHESGQPALNLQTAPRGCCQYSPSRPVGDSHANRVTVLAHSESPRLGVARVSVSYRGRIPGCFSARTGRGAFVCLAGQSDSASDPRLGTLRSYCGVAERCAAHRRAGAPARVGNPSPRSVAIVGGTASDVLERFVGAPSQEAAAAPAQSQGTDRPLRVNAGRVRRLGSVTPSGAETCRAPSVVLPLFRGFV